MPHEAMDIETVAGLLGVSSRQIRNYVTLGMPSRREGRTPVFSWRETLEWYVGYRIGLESGDRPSYARDEAFDDEGDFPEATAGGKRENIGQATLRKTRADADLRELALSRQRGEVITIADAKVRLDRMMGNLRSKLLSMAPKLASRIEGLKARTEREAAVKDEMETLCREISTGAVVDLPDDSETIDEITASMIEPIPSLPEEWTSAAREISNLEILRGVAELLNDEAYS